MTVVAGCFQRVVQTGDQLGRLDVDRVLVAERAALLADDEPELLDVPRQLGEGEAGLFALVPVEKLERLEVAQELVPRTDSFVQAVEVLSGLISGGFQVPPGAFLLNQQDAGPQKVDEAGGVIEPLEVLFVPR